MLRRAARSLGRGASVQCCPSASLRYTFAKLPYIPSSHSRCLSTSFSTGRYFSNLPSDTDHEDRLSSSSPSSLLTDDYDDRGPTPEPPPAPTPHLRPREVPNLLESSLPPLSSSISTEGETAQTIGLVRGGLAGSSNVAGSGQFDITRYSKMLQTEGFTAPQADAILQLVNEAVSESMENIGRSMVTKTEQAEEVSDAERDFAQLRADIQMLEKRDFAVLRGELERILAEVERMKQGMRDEVSRVHGGVRLDINLEKARIQDEAAQLKDLVAKAEARIDQEIDILTNRMVHIRDGTKASLKRMYSFSLMVKRERMARSRN
ncbi:uncharacterized protein EV422DRAFT_415862 [Fimicolochytrium jonesii]|uniref:uncharacterized protein n=1 Tax=Fimicolochytrium jonesii TaxID=1396493 RepID=UPI0022FE8BFF|nr:uncharacterized protein EV422DRAFT_415862 [Fimicolochytrium jonesii]KAI8822066.1 hypothetical protein EV422DRAFT_415862 [Fimicolochytrium jonesii]